MAGLRLTFTLPKRRLFTSWKVKSNVLIGERTVTATTGAFVLVPRDTVHTFSKAGTTPAKILIIISPAGFENFF